MAVKLKRVIRKLKSFWKVLNGVGKISFSQFGEDLIVISFLDRFNIKNVTYLDIGANDPVKINNTYNLYLRGYTGVLVEPNSFLCKKIENVRPKDTVLNCGIGMENTKSVDYYMFAGNDGVYNTFSKETALETEREGIPIEKTVKLELVGINEILDKHFQVPPTLLSLDVEGLDEEILKSIDFSKHKPLLICVETVNFSASSELIKNKAIIEYLTASGYIIYADTHINTIFCHKEQYRQFFKK